MALTTMSARKTTRVLCEGHPRKFRQVTALPWRLGEDGTIVILLVTSRVNKKWMLPKGWSMAGKSDAEAALIEAVEEAGIVGHVSETPLGSYEYVKVLGHEQTRASEATIYAVRLVEEQAIWDEMEQRDRRWFSPRDAASVVFERDLSRFLENVATGRIALRSDASTPCS